MKNSLFTALVLAKTNIDRPIPRDRQDRQTYSHLIFVAEGFKEILGVLEIPHLKRTNSGVHTYLGSWKCLNGIIWFLGKTCQNMRASSTDCFKGFHLMNRAHDGTTAIFYVGSFRFKKYVLMSESRWSYILSHTSTLTPDERFEGGCAFRGIPLL